MAYLFDMTELSHLIERCKKGDSRSQRELYDLLKEKLMGVCYRYSQSEEDARDAFQETMIRVFKDINNLTEIKNVVGWVNRIARNVAIDSFRKSKTEMIVNIDDSEVIQFSSEELSALEVLEGLEIIDLIKKLPYNQMLPKI